MKVFTLTTDIETRVYTSREDANVAALSEAQWLWRCHVKQREWPLEPETWQQILEEIQTRMPGLGVSIYITEHDLPCEVFVVGYSNTDEAIVIPTLEEALRHATDVVEEGDHPLLWEAYSIPLEIETSARVGTL